MRVVLQRVSRAAITINGFPGTKMGHGIVVLLGIVSNDDSQDAEWLVKKILNLRIFDDEEGIMNLSLKDIQGEILVVSQFTLHAQTKKGNRPSYIKAAKPEIATPIYNQFLALLRKELNREIHTGEFGAHMEIELVNDGPVTILIDSKNRE